MAWRGGGLDVRMLVRRQWCCSPPDWPGGVVDDDPFTQAERRLIAQHLVSVAALRCPVAQPETVDYVRLAPMPPQGAERLIPVTAHGFSVIQEPYGSIWIPWDYALTCGFLTMPA